ncbi:MAG: EAL domain-containing protein, partial [Lachnospiraceae bacterium]|nr:EAL domain-containing protein [Lachnospiraceae bacterium]
ATIQILKNLGFKLWLDDFGSGYSSLNMLKDYSFDVMKIDMVFLKHFGENDKSKTILQSIVNLADSINMETLTEGVEEEEQAEFLKSIGCKRLQGYLFGKAMPKDELKEKYECF